MKVLFVYYDTSASDPPRIGFGVAYLSAFLKKHGHETKLSYFRSSNELNYTLSLIEEWEPQIVAHSSTSSSFYSVGDVVRKIRRRFPDLFQICGGNHVSLLPDEFLKLPELDAICIGYGEYPLSELADAIQDGKDYKNIKNLHIRFNGKIIKNSLREFPEDLDSFIPCDRKLFLDELNRHSIPLPYDTGIFGKNVQEFIFSRGCPFECTFCCNHALKKLGSGKYINFPSVSKCIDEMVQVKQEMNMTGVDIHDDILTLNKNWFRDFMLEYKKKVSLPFICNLRVNCFNKEDVRYLKESGCAVAVLGIESGNEYIRNKVMRKKIKYEDIISAYNLLHKFGIITFSQNIIGLPEETPGRFLDTIRINARIIPNYTQLYVFYPYPGTVLYNHCVKENLFEERNNEILSHERVDTILKLPDFPREDILFYMNNFKRLIRYEYLSNRYGIIKKILPLNLKNQKIIIRVMGIISFGRSVIKKLLYRSSS
jgi:radical SAM superfamily enzyme YgiQ (UPF0313 family)